MVRVRGQVSSVCHGCRSHHGVTVVSCVSSWWGVFFFSLGVAALWAVAMGIGQCMAVVWFIVFHCSWWLVVFKGHLSHFAWFHYNRGGGGGSRSRSTDSDSYHTVYDILKLWLCSLIVFVGWACVRV
jgi:hypothetical protein